MATRCITLEGDDFNPGGTLTGGSRNRGASVLVRRATGGAGGGRTAGWRREPRSRGGWVTERWGVTAAAAWVCCARPGRGAEPTAAHAAHSCPHQARLHELAAAEEQLAAAQAGLQRAQAALQAMAAAAQQYKK